MLIEEQVQVLVSPESCSNFQQTMQLLACYRVRVLHLGQEGRLEAALMISVNLISAVDLPFGSRPGASMFKIQPPSHCVCVRTRAPVLGIRVLVAHTSGG